MELQEKFENMLGSNEGLVEDLKEKQNSKDELINRVQIESNMHKINNEEL